MVMEKTIGLQHYQTLKIKSESYSKSSSVTWGSLTNKSTKNYSLQQVMVSSHRMFKSMWGNNGRYCNLSGKHNLEHPVIG